MINRRELIVLGGTAAVLASAGIGRAADWPTKPVTLISAYPPGGTSDIIARLVADPSYTSIVVVTAAEAFAVQESQEFVRDLERRLGRRPSAFIVNALYPALPPGRVGDEPDDGPLAIWRARAAANHREIARFSAWWAGPWCALPLVTHGRGPALVAELASRLAVAAEVPA